MWIAVSRSAPKMSTPLNRVALLGKTVADNLFGGGDPVGQVIRIHNVPLTVIGVLSRKSQSPTGQDQDDVV
jgi:putative ABC transport system permease protein